MGAMATEAVERESFLPHGRPFTRADLETMPGDGNRYEIIEGVLLVSAVPRPIHQSVLIELVMLLRPLCIGDLMLLAAPLDVELADDTVVQPDLLVARRADLTATHLVGAPVLTVEILSPSTKHLDLAYKRARYEAAGVPSYWVIDPDGPSIIAWELIDGAYTEVGRATDDTVLTLNQPFPVTIVPAALV